MKYHESLDGFRGLSVFLVFLFHTKATASGWIGVEMFFVLSGYLITTILLETRELPVRRYLTRFYWRRTMRIWPLYFAFFLVLLGLSETLDALDEFRQDIGYIVSFTYNFRIAITQDWQESYSHLWSLSIEEQFYLLWPMVVYLASRTTLRRIALALIVLAPVIRFVAGELYMTRIYPEHLPLRPDEVYPFFPRGMFVYMFSASHFDAFATGALLALLPEGWKRRRWLFSPILACVITALVVAVGVWFAASWGAEKYDLHGNFYHIHLRYSYQFIWGYSAINLFSAGLLLALTRPNWLQRMFCVGPLAYLGKVSFGFYVLHVPVKQILEAYAPWLEPGSLSFDVVWFALGWLVAALSYHGFESLFLRRKDFWERRARRSAASNDGASRGSGASSRDGRRADGVE